MSNEIATRERVQAAVEALHKEDKRATADAVLSVLGGGSKGTVLKHLRALRQDGDAQPQALPNAVVDLARPVIADIFNAGAAAHEAQTREKIERYHRIMSDLEMQVDELVAANDKQEQEMVSLRKDLVRALNAKEEALDLNQQHAAEIERLSLELAGSREATAQSLTTHLQAFEKQIADLTARLNSEGAKSAPSKKGPGRPATD